MKFLQYTFVLLVMLWGLRGMVFAEEQAPTVVAIIDEGFSYDHSTAAWYVGEYVHHNLREPRGHGARVVDEMIYHWEHHGVTLDDQRVRILPISFDIEAPRYGERLAKAIDQAVDGGATVINISSGVPYFSRTLYATMLKYHRQGIVFVAAAGNNPDSYALYPARYRFVVGVGWVDTDANTVRGPRGGVALVVDQQDMYQPQGSSFAAPLVSSIIALEVDQYRRNTKEWLSHYVSSIPKLPQVAQGAGAFRYERYPTVFPATRVPVESKDTPEIVSLIEEPIVEKSVEVVTPQPKEDSPKEQIKTDTEEIIVPAQSYDESVWSLVSTPSRPAFFSTIKEALEYYQQRNLEVIPMTKKEG